MALHRARQADAERLHRTFNGRMRDELLNESLFLDLHQARQLIAVWIAIHNTMRPHSSLGYRTPEFYADYLTATGHRAALHDGSGAPAGCSYGAERRINCLGLESSLRTEAYQWQVNGHRTLRRTRRTAPELDKDLNDKNSR